MMILLAQLSNMLSRSKTHENECETEKSGALVNYRTISNQVIQCFSFVDNWNLICSTGKPSNAIPVVDGLK